ncbi:MAG TPA: lamin tail domain-containing protein, partial [Bacillota bacterium]|nr:lamin tail domain-containing protein [Bacillota bacterium]
APYAFEAIGNPTPAGSFRGTPDGYDITAGGRDIGGTSDQFQFAYQAFSGSFDIKVRLRSLDQTDPYAKAGLMVREDLTPGSRFAAVLATPTISGAFFQARSAAYGGTTTSGALSVNYPDTWLRLQRAGDQFVGYASYDGLTWQQLGSVTLALTNTFYFGMAVCSHNSSQAATAQFRELSAVTNAVTGVLALPNEPLGPSSRRTGLAITELMYHPQARTDGRSLEFIEIFNPQPFFEDISGYALSGDIAFTFPPGTVLAAGAYLVVAAAPADLQAVYGLANVVGPYTNNLSNSSGTVRLRNKIGAVLLEVKYDSVPPWPASADGAGHSLVLARPSYGEGDPHAWAASDLRGGSPGRTDGYGPEPARPVVLNEFLAHTDLPELDSIELFNRGSQPVDLSGCYLTDDPQTNKFRLPDGTRLTPRGFIAFDETRLGFRLDAAGETIYLINAANTRVLDAVRFEGQVNGISSGRWPDGAPSFRALTTKTLGTNNSPALSPSIVINEIMYDPLSGNEDDQYVELYNQGTSRVDLSGWKFTAGISYTFRSNTFLAANAYLVVARNTSRMLTNYPNLNATNLVGNFDGSLAGRGERLALSMPDDIVSTNSHGVVTTNMIYIVVNEVAYGIGGRWGQWANRGGSSLELI